MNVLETFLKMQIKHKLTSIEFYHVRKDNSDYLKIIVRDGIYQSGRLIEKESLQFRVIDELLLSMANSLVSFRERAGGLKQ